MRIRKDLIIYAAVVALAVITVTVNPFNFTGKKNKAQQDAAVSADQTADNTAQNAAQADTQNIAPSAQLIAYPATLVSSDILSFAKSYASLKPQLASFKMAESKDPSFEDIYTYTLAQGTLPQIEEILAGAGITADKAFLRYYIISTSYGICSYERALKSNPALGKMLKKSAGPSIEKARAQIHTADISLVDEYFTVLDSSFKAAK